MQKLEGFKQLPLGEIKPEGWLKRELRLQADGLSGHIDEVWKDISHSAWCGGKGEAWERGPYYLDGLIPLAYLLEDDALIKKANRWVEWILSSQNAEGGFGPTRSRDWWPRSVALKALISYYEATNDQKVIAFMIKYFKYMLKELDGFPPNLWGTARALEYIIPIEYVYERSGEPFLKELANKLKGYSYDWFDYFSNFKYKKSARKYISRTAINIGRKVGAKWQNNQVEGTKPLKEKPASAILRTNNLNFCRKLMLLHAVNVAMALKYPVLWGHFTNEENNYDIAKKGWLSVLKYHGTATGMFTADEFLDGCEPTRGIELCAVVESMYSAECMLARTGDLFYADMLELLAFNALPATLTADCMAHQYVQQVNQIEVSVADRDFFNVDDDGNLYGLAPNFGCCAANMHQGFPKFATQLCYKAENALAFMVYSPCTVYSELKNGKIIISETTDYPFSEKIKFKVESYSGNSEIKLFFRVPEFTSMKVLVNGNEEASGDGGILSVKAKFKAGDIIELKLNMPVTVIDNPDKTISFRRGSVLLASKLKSVRKPIGGKAPFYDFGVTTEDDWRMAPVIGKDGLEVLDCFEAAIDKMPFNPDNPPLEVDIKAKVVENWYIYKNMADKPPKRAVYGEEETLTLVPYGATDLRIAHFKPAK